MQNEFLVMALSVTAFLGSLGLCWPFLKQKKRWFLFSVPLFLCIAIEYLAWGGYFSLLDYHQKLAKTREVDAILASPEKTKALIKRITAQLDDRPESASGWILVGKLYLVLHEEKKARDAFEKAKH